MADSKKTEQERLRKEFDDLADKRFAEIVETGNTIPWSEMRKYLEDRLAGKAAPRPIARKRVVNPL